VLLHLIFHGLELAITGYTIVYPAFRSVRAIETDEKNDDKIWLSYWVVFGMLLVLETFAAPIFWIIPLWGYIRFGFFVFLLSFGGAEKVALALANFMKQHESDINSVLDGFKEAANEGLDEAKK